MKKPKQTTLDLDGGGIIRVEKRERWLTIENSTVRDKRLTFGARGLHHFILSFPNKWELKVRHLVKHSPAGRDAVYAMLRELEKFRYLIRKKDRGHKGRIVWISTIYETPQGEPLSDEEVRQLHGGRPKKRKADKPSLPFTEKPYLAGPDTVEPDTAGPDAGRPDTARPDTAGAETKELPSDESSRDESLKASGRAAPSTPTPTKEPGGAAGVGVSAGKFNDEQYQLYIEECIRRKENIESPAGLLIYLRRGEMDARVERVLSEIERRAQPVKCPPTCPKCFGSGWESVPGQGARKCPNLTPEGER
ncbi:MAG TPA: hypothetical protein VGX48_17810 [Pyrinomonadaceae bacterium]|nr:hypothetical protein [Pyrinomonadaceae bacterium]